MIRWLSLVIALAAPLHAQDLPAFFSVTGVAANDVLNIRARPDAQSEIIGSLAFDATGIEVVRISGDWGLINSGDSAGYASLRYLERAPGPQWTALQSPILCLGTEPFWSLEIDPQGDRVRLATPEDPEPTDMAIEALWPAGPWARSAAVGLPDGMAVLVGAECSDGMSDRAYGIAVDIFRQEPEGETRRAGCCRLAQP